MKTFHKYGNGYINIDDSMIYLTSTGNWSEIETLTEKTIGKNTKKTGKIISISIFFGVLCILLLVFFLSTKNSIPFKLFVLASGIIGIAKLKDYFSTETGERFYIPKSKVICITPDENNLTIEFKSVSGEPDMILIANVKGNIELIIREMLEQEKHLKDQKKD
jgi:hypothetical protein